MFKSGPHPELVEGRGHWSLHPPPVTPGLDPGVHVFLGAVMRAHPLPLSFSAVRIHAPSEGAIRTCPDPLPHQGGNRGAWVSLAWMFGTRRLGHAPTPPTAHLSDDQIHAPRYCGAMIWFMWGRSALFSDDQIHAPSVVAICFFVHDVQIHAARKRATICT